jgi:DNA-binding CsgD family transcriptional regulator
MEKNSLQLDSDQELIQNLLHQRAAERAQIRRWNFYSLILIWLVLVIIIVLSIFDFDPYLIGLIALLGLGGLWFITYRQGKKLEIKFFRQEIENFQNISPVKIVQNSISDPEPLQSPLSPREMEVLSLIVQGNSNKEIAKLMNITPQTTKNHITHILKKLNVDDRTAAAVTALRMGWIKHSTNNDSINKVNALSSE